MLKCLREGGTTLIRTFERVHTMQVLLSTCKEHFDFLLWWSFVLLHAEKFYLLVIYTLCFKLIKQARQH